VELAGDDHLPWVNPQPIVDEIEQFLTGAHQAADVDRQLMTVLFTDIVASTARAASVGDREWRAVLADHDRLVRAQLHEYNGREVKTTGDGFLATFDGPARAIRCACAIRDTVKAELGLGVRAGIHTGECEVVDDDVAGMAVHIGARVGSLAGEGEVLVSSTVKDLVVGSGFAFADRGEHSLKGVPGAWRTFAVQGEGSSGVTPIPVEPKGRSERVLLLAARRTPSMARLAARMSDRRFRKASHAPVATG
jgi:class 3 adenylate cyclase